MGWLERGTTGFAGGIPGKPTKKKGEEGFRRRRDKRETFSLLSYGLVVIFNFFAESKISVLSSIKWGENPNLSPFYKGISQ